MIPMGSSCASGGSKRRSVWRVLAGQNGLHTRGPRAESPVQDNQTEDQENDPGNGDDGPDSFLNKLISLGMLHRGLCADQQNLPHTGNDADDQELLHDGLDVPRLQVSDNGSEQFQDDNGKQDAAQDRQAATDEGIGFSFRSGFLAALFVAFRLGL